MQYVSLPADAQVGILPSKNTMELLSRIAQATKN